MISFKEAARKDLANTFLSLTEFADLHKINGKEMPVIVDENELIEREKRMKSNMDGIYARTILIYVRGVDFGLLPAIRSKVRLDEKEYLVQEAVNEYGVYSITLEMNKG